MNLIFLILLLLIATYLLIRRLNHCPVEFPHPPKPVPSSWSDDEVTISWLGHATFLINFYGTRLIIDPALEKRIGVTPFKDFTIGLKRCMKPALMSDEVGKLDLVIVSHAHTDHFDFPTARDLQSESTVAVTPRHTSYLWRKMKYKEVVEMHWGEKKEIEGVKIRVLEGRHWGARLPWNKKLEANSYLISKNGVNIFFGGDTAYTTKFKKQLEGIPIHVAMFGISAYKPDSFQDRHATPEQAWKMAEEIGARWVIPMHWGSFRLSKEPMDEPMERFKKAVGDRLEKVPIQYAGETWILPKDNE